MRFKAVTALACTLLFAIAAYGEKPQLNQTRLWAAGEDGYDLYRIPGIVVTADGTVLAYGVARCHITHGDWGDFDIVLRRSTDGGKHWDKSRRIAGNTHGVTDNPVAISSQEKGVVHFLYQRNYNSIYYMKSKDDGASFSDPVDITSALVDPQQQFSWEVVALGPGHAIELKNGRLLVPVWIGHGELKPDGHRERSHLGITTLYSDDQGKTWAHGDIIALNTPEMKDPNEMQVIQLADGSVMANARTRDTQYLRAIAVSPDGISHWTKPQFDPHLFDSWCAAGIVRYDDRRILFTNPDSSAMPRKMGSYAPRQNLTVRMSEDEGKTWPVSRTLVPGLSGYSDIAADPKRRMIYEIYEQPDNPKKTKTLSLYVARFNLAWLTQKQ